MAAVYFVKMKGSKNQYLCCLILSIITFMTSFGMVWSSYAIPMLEGDHTPLNQKISKRDGDLIGSLPMLGSFLGTIVVGYITDRFGRKKSEVLCVLFLTLSWAITATAKVSMQILIARLIFGLGISIHYVVSLIFVGETTHPSIKGTITSIQLFSLSSGALGSYLLGWLCSFEVVCYINLTLGVLSVVLVCLMKETPAYLLSKGDDKEALRSLKFYRAASTTTEEILDEFNYIKSQSMNNSSHKLEKSPNEKEKLNKESYLGEKKMSPLKILLMCKSSQRIAVSVYTIASLTMFMGMSCVQAYAGQFFTMVAPNISPHLCSVVLAIVLAVSSGVAACITDLFERRVLMISSTSTVSISLALIGMQLRWKFAPDWIIPVLVVFYCVSFQLGVNNIPYVYASECFATEVRGLGMQLLICFICLSNFFLLLTFGPAVQYIGLDGTFFVFSVIGTLLIIVEYLFMRETRGVLIEDVQDMFANGYLYRKNNKISINS